MNDIDNNIKSSQNSNYEDNKSKILNMKIVDNSLSVNNNTNNTKDNIMEIDKNNSLLNQNRSSSTNIEKDKRQRRGKNEISERIYKCPDCDKSYLSGPALMIHRKIKHNYNKINENKTRGRPKKDYQLENSYNIAQNKYNSFLDNNIRKPFINDENKDINKITLEQVKNNLSDIFNQYKLELFQKIYNI